MKIVTRTAAAAMLISLPMALGACGGGDSKPSKADVKVGFAKVMKSMPSGKNVPAPTMTKIADCVVDKTYDKVTAKTLNAMKSGDKNSKADKKDEKTVTDATTTCATAAASGK
jgi:hypothetical protein